MKKKELKKLVVATKSEDPKVIVGKLMANKDVSMADMSNITKIMESLGLVTNDFKVMATIRKEELTVAILKAVKTWEHMQELVQNLQDDYDLDEAKILSTIRNAMKREKIAVPRKPSLGLIKQAIVDYMGGTDAPTPADLKAFLLDNVEFAKDKKENETKAQHAVSMNFAFAVGVYNACK